MCFRSGLWSVARLRGRSLISAIIPVKNGADFIGDAIESLFDQGDLISEIIVVNNGSTDETEKVVKSYKDNRIKLIGSDIPNLPLSRNIGAEQATCDWLYFLDADDRVLPGSLQKLVQAWPKEDNYAVVYGDYLRMTESGEVIGQPRKMLPSKRKSTGDVLPAFLTGNQMIVGAQIVRRDWFLKAGCFNPDLRFAEDWEFWCRLAAIAKFHFVPGLMVIGYRINAVSMSHKKILSFNQFEPVINEIYSQPVVQENSKYAKLRRKAEAHCCAYICTEAVRSGAHGAALKAYLQAIRNYPTGIPKITLKYLGAYTGF